MNNYYLIDTKQMITSVNHFEPVLVLVTGVLYMTATLRSWLAWIVLLPGIPQLTVCNCSAFLGSTCGPPKTAAFAVVINHVNRP